MVTRNDPEEWEMRGDDKPEVKVKVKTKGELQKPVHVIVTPASADTKVKAK